MKASKCKVKEKLQKWTSKSRASNPQNNSFHTPATYVHPVCWPDYGESKNAQKRYSKAWQYRLSSKTMRNASFFKCQMIQRNNATTPGLLCYIMLHTMKPSIWHKKQNFHSRAHSDWKKNWVLEKNPHSLLYVISLVLTGIIPTASVSNNFVHRSQARQWHSASAQYHQVFTPNNRGEKVNSGASLDC